MTPSVLPDFTADRLNAIQKAWDEEEAQHEAQQKAVEVAEAQINGFIPCFSLHRLDIRNYIAIAPSMDWEEYVDDIADDDRIHSVNFLYSKVLHIRILKEINPDELKDLIDFSYLPF
ncbi:MAG: hypothetical protein GY705_03215 [Bacteroidetes bacterium]|nr:hypothetical protein [Bacteroidota bacterium]